MLPYSTSCGSDWCCRKVLNSFQKLTAVSDRGNTGSSSVNNDGASPVSLWSGFFFCLHLLWQLKQTPVALSYCKSAKGVTAYYSSCIIFCFFVIAFYRNWHGDGHHSSSSYLEPPWGTWGHRPGLTGDCGSAAEVGGGVTASARRSAFFLKIVNAEMTNVGV